MDSIYLLRFFKEVDQAKSQQSFVSEWYSISSSMEAHISNQCKKYKTLKVNILLFLDEFKVRGDKLNPILKNTLFEMMNKEPTKRLELGEAKRRLSLQKYITSESRGSVTTTTRIVRRTQ